MLRWSWLLLLSGLVVVALLLAWADSTLFRPAFPQPFEPPRRTGLRPPGPPELPLAPFGFGRLEFQGLGRVGGLYTFWWFLSMGVGLILVTLGPLLALPLRIRRAAERVRPAALSLMLAAGVAAALLGLAASVLLRVTFVLLSFVPLLWAVAAFGIVFGVAALALAFGRWLSWRLGPAPPLVAAVAGLLVLVDVGLVPIAGPLFLVVVAVTSLGLAVLTRVGSPAGWSLEELNW
ncbi:MAG TPA: hypothetical protein VOB72_15450 [Candidatus Dormibacteraeota bacterium]|nr:hypothetical protein [Candidatus Dormibacteraeota bacterium]